MSTEKIHARESGNDGLVTDDLHLEAPNVEEKKLVSNFLAGWRLHAATVASVLFNT